MTYNINMVTVRKAHQVKNAVPVAYVEIEAVAPQRSRLVPLNHAAFIASSCRLASPLSFPHIESRGEVWHP